MNRRGFLAATGLLATAALEGGEHTPAPRPDTIGSSQHGLCPSILHLGVVDGKLHSYLFYLLVDAKTATTLCNDRTEGVWNRAAMATLLVVRSSQTPGIEDATASAYDLRTSRRRATAQYRLRHLFNWYGVLRRPQAQAVINQVAVFIDPARDPRSSWGASGSESL